MDCTLSVRAWDCYNSLCRQLSYGVCLGLLDAVCRGQQRAARFHLEAAVWKAARHAAATTTNNSEEGRPAPFSARATLMPPPAASSVASPRCLPARWIKEFPRFPRNKDARRWARFSICCPSRMLDTFHRIKAYEFVWMILGMLVDRMDVYSFWVSRGAWRLSSTFFSPGLHSLRSTC